MSRRVVSVTTGSRLHFGMFSLGTPGVRQFGGVGVMIDQPAVRLQITEAETLSATGPMAEAALKAAHALSRENRARRRAAGSKSITLHPATPAWEAARSWPWLSPRETARSKAPSLFRPNNWRRGRAATLRRRIVWLFARRADRRVGQVERRRDFAPGGASRPVARVAIPARPTASERRTIGRRRAVGVAQLPPRAPQRDRGDVSRGAMELLPAAIERRFDRFSDSLYRYGQQAGSCFALLQAGVYATAEVAAAARLLADVGVVGVAQCWWGPTLFAVLPSQQAAEATFETLRRSDSRWGGTAPSRGP